MVNDNIIISGGCAEVVLNPKFFKLETVFSAAYILLDKAYFIFDGNPKSKIRVTIRPKQKQNPRKLAELFNDELINYSVYEKQLKSKQALREEMLKRALLTNITEEDDYKEDKEQILVPWEEKYGT